MSTTNEKTETMLAATTFAVVGASDNSEKYGNRVYRMLKEYGRTVYPVNLTAETVDGDRAYARVADLPETPEVVVAVIPPPQTELLIPQLAARGVRNLWMQPGAESPAAIAAGIAVVHSGPCILVGLRTHGGRPASR